MSHCHVSVTLEWIQTILGYRQRQQCRLSAEFLLLLSQYSLLSNLEAHLTHHLSSFITPLLLTTVLCSTRIFEFPPEGGYSPPHLCMMTIHCFLIMVDPSSLQVRADPTPPNTLLLFLSPKAINTSCYFLISFQK